MLPSLNPSITELTTAATDAAMGIVCLALLTGLRGAGVPALRRAVWSWVFGLLMAASLLGAVAHGFDLRPGTRAALWWPLYLSLGLAVALFLVGAVLDGRGEREARVLLPWAIGLGIVFFAISQSFGGAFIIFVAYEGAVLIAALMIYLTLALRRRLQGAWLVSAGIALSLVAAAVQASTLAIRVIVPFDHNGLFHLVQIAATFLISKGIRRSSRMPVRKQATGRTAVGRATS